jgi:hypothetical protein
VISHERPTDTFAHRPDHEADRLIRPASTGRRHKAAMRWATMGATASGDGLDVRMEAPVARLTLDRPDKLNALNDDIRRGFVDALAELEERTDIRVAADDIVVRIPELAIGIPLT